MKISKIEVEKKMCSVDNTPIISGRSTFSGSIGARLGESVENIQNGGESLG